MHARSLKIPADKQAAIASALRTVEIEQSGLSALAAALENGLSEPFARAVEMLASIQGRVIVTGVGKSGHIGSKIAATLASTGTPAFFVHPAEANHGDLGMIAKDDAIIAMSWSGESLELKGIVAYSGASPSRWLPSPRATLLRLRARRTSFSICREVRKPALMGLLQRPRRSFSSRSETRWLWRYSKRGASRRIISAHCIRADSSAPA